MKSKDLEVDILNQITIMQLGYSDLIRPGGKVHEEYGLLRSFRRGLN